MEHRPSLVAYETRAGTIASYTLGFFLSLVLTATAFLLVGHWNALDVAAPSRGLASAMVIGLALLQLAVQSFCFLHVSPRARSRWGLVAFLFTLLLVSCIALGSLWIMKNLNNNMTPQEIDMYMQNQD